MDLHVLRGRLDGYLWRPTCTRVVTLPLENRDISIVCYLFCEED